MSDRSDRGSGRDRGGDRNDRGDRGDRGEGGRSNPIRKDANGKPYCDYKDVDTLRRAMSPNGKIHGRKRLSTTAREQRLVATAIKRARYMGLLP